MIITIKFQCFFKESDHMEFVYVNPRYVTNLNYKNSVLAVSKIKKVVYIKKLTKQNHTKYCQMQSTLINTVLNL